jgi:hypothetical protein
MAERLGNAVEEGLAADEAVIGQQVGAIGEMLAAAEADLQMERAIVTEQPLAVISPSSGTRCGQAAFRPARPGSCAACARSTGHTAD